MARCCTLLVLGFLLIFSACGKSAGTASDGVEGLRSAMKAFMGVDKAKAAELSRQFKPTEADCVAILGDTLGKKVSAEIEKIWNDDTMVISFRESQTEIIIHAAKGKDLAAKTGEWSKFAGGYVSMGDKLAPETTFYTVRFVEPGKTSGMRYDLFAFVNGKWCVFPKIYRLLK